MTVDNISAITGYDPFDLETRKYPYDHYAWLRENSPAYYVAEHDFWILSRHEHVAWGVNATDVLSSAEGIAVERVVDLSALGMEGAENLSEVMISKDPPDHRRLRDLVQKEFTPRRIAGWEAKVRDITEACVHDLIEHNKSGNADLTEHLATPLPVTVIAEILGIPTADRKKFKDWSEDIVYLIGGGIDPALQMTALGSAMELATYFDAIVNERRAQPGEDLISVLLGSTKDGDSLAHHEVIAQCMLFLIGGNETTTNLIGNTLHALVQHPDQLRRCVEDPSLIEWAIEETLRWDAPVQGLFRTSRSPFEIDGTEIPNDARVQLLYGSANRDERQYPNAANFDLDRRSRNHFAFGGGPHYCIGAPLARLETRIAMEYLLPRIRNIEIRDEPQMNYNVLVRGFRSLPIAFDA